MFGLGGNPLLYGFGGSAPTVPVTVEEPEDPEFVEPGVPNLYAMLIKPIRDADKRDGGELLRRFLRRGSKLFKRRLDMIRSLATLDSPAAVRADLLQYQKNTVGFTSDLDHITAGIDTNSLRRLVSLAVPLWNKRGTSEGLVEWIRLLTGRAVQITDWFAFRWLLDENGTGLQDADTWLIGGELTPLDEFTSHLRVMDRGTLDRQLLLQLVGLSRLLSERIEIAIVDFLDLFEENRGLWSNIDGPPGYIASGRFMLPPGAVEEASVVITDDAGQVVDSSLYGAQHTSQHIFQLGAAGDAHVVTWAYREGRPALVVTVTAGSLSIGWTGSSPIGTLPVAVFSGLDYRLRIDHDYEGGSLQVKVYLDEARVVWITPSVGSAPTGTFRLSAPGSNTGTTQVDQVELFRHPLRFAEVKPGQTDTSANFLER